MFTLPRSLSALASPDPDDCVCVGGLVPRNCLPGVRHWGSREVLGAQAHRQDPSFSPAERLVCGSMAGAVLECPVRLSVCPSCRALLVAALARGEGSVFNLFSAAVSPCAHVPDSYPPAGFVAEHSTGASFVIHCPT